MTTSDGETVYEYDELDRLIKTVYPDGNSETLKYDGIGNIASSYDRNGNKTSYKYDAAGNVIETIDALGNSAIFKYDAVGNLIETKLHRVDEQDKVNSWEITAYEFDSRGLVTKQIDALGNVTTTETTYTYDERDRLVKAHDDYGNSTREYIYDSLGNLTYETGNGSHAADHRYNDLNQQISRSTDKMPMVRRAYTVITDLAHSWKIHG